MKRALCLFVVVSLAFCGDETELIVIGTMHSDGPQFTTDHLHRILTELKPDVILFERDASMLTEDNWFPAIEKPELEERAVTRLRDHHSFELRPYDLDGRRQFKIDHEFKQNNKALGEAIDGLYQSGKLSAINVLKVDTIAAITRALLELGKEPAYVFNAPSSSALVLLRKETLYEHYTEIIASTPELAPFAEHWERVKTFWVKRNKAMVANIAAHTETYAGKRLVVLSGFSHKYFLMDGLRHHQGFKLVEYWDVIGLPQPSNTTQP